MFLSGSGDGTLHALNIENPSELVEQCSLLFLRFSLFGSLTTVSHQPRRVILLPTNNLLLSYDVVSYYSLCFKLGLLIRILGESKGLSFSSLAGKSRQMESRHRNCQSESPACIYKLHSNNLELSLSCLLTLDCSLVARSYLGRGSWAIRFPGSTSVLLLRLATS
ncbi:unnamed protein product [Cochlearia groenlandica]